MTRVISASVLLVLVMLIFCAAVPAQETTQYNIYTVDRNRPGFGDVASNWLVAKHLRATQGHDVQINLYISRAHYHILRTLNNGFNPNGPAMQVLDGINVYRSITGEGDAAHAIPIGENRIACNLAFTVDQPEHLTEPEALINLPNPQQHVIVRSAANIDLKNSAIRANSPPGSIVPFLAFEVPGGSGFNRIDERKTGRLFFSPHRENGSYFPAVFFHSTFLNNLLFISNTTPDPVAPINTPLGIEVDHFGFAYASVDRPINAYIDKVEQLANANQDRTFAIAIPKSGYDVAGTTVPHTDTIAGLPNAEPGLIRRSRGMNGNLKLFIYPNNIPYDQTTRLIRNTTIPILVSGTMSLSQALQYDKPFLYEVKRHLDFIARDMGAWLRGDDRFHEVLISADQFTQFSVMEMKVGPTALPPPVDASRQLFANIARRGASRRSDRWLFGINWTVEQANLPWANDQISLDFQPILFPGHTADLQAAMTNYAQYQQGLINYRNDPDGHLLDNVPLYCDEVRGTMEELRNMVAEGNTKEDDVMAYLLSDLEWDLDDDE